MKILDTRELAVPDVKVVTYARFPDDRGFFSETLRPGQIGEALGEPDFQVAQINESRSRGGVFRGLHAQWNPWQGKLVRPTMGRLIDLALDIRKGSPTFGKLVADLLDAERSDVEGEWIWLPPGFAHGTLFAGDCRLEYACTAEWSPGFELSISPRSPGIDWSLCDEGLAEEVRASISTGILSSGKDRSGIDLDEWAASDESAHFTYAPGERWSIADRG